MVKPRSISFQVFGTPQPKGSARAFKRGERIIVTSDNPSLRAWEDAVRAKVQEIAGDVFFEGAVSLHVTFHLQRPKSISVKKRPFMVTRPDTSKLIRGLEDALTEILWKDDSQVIVITASKLYAAPGEASRVDVTVMEVIDHVRDATDVLGLSSSTV